MNTTEREIYKVLEFQEEKASAKIKEDLGEDVTPELRDFLLLVLETGSWRRPAPGSGGTAGWGFG